jgi:competence protein ComEC
MKKKEKRLLAVMLALTMLLGGCAQAEQQSVQSVEMLVINVGKADALLISLGKQRYLIDTGTAESWGKLQYVLENQGVERLDGVFLTHTDKDHGGGMAALAKSDIEVEHWYAAQIFHEKKQKNHQAVRAARARGQQVEWLKAGDKIQAGESWFTVLGPLSKNTENENNNSLVMRLDTPEGAMLLTGDMEFAEEAELLASGANLSAAVLKVAHHGEDDATSDKLVAAVSPQIAVISTNTLQEPDTPAASVLAVLEAANVQVFQTQDADLGVRVTLKEGAAQAQLEQDAQQQPVTDDIQLVELDAKQDYLVIENAGEEEKSLAGWYLFSEKGNELFVFPEGASVAPDQQILVGSLSYDGEADYRWPEENVFHNKKKDDVLLYDALGRLVTAIANGN